VARTIGLEPACCTSRAATTHCASCRLGFAEAVAGCCTIREEIKAILDATLDIMDERYEITVLLMRAQTELSEAELAGRLDPSAAHGLPAGMYERAVQRGEIWAERSQLITRLVPSLLWGLSVLSRDRALRPEIVSAFTQLLDSELFTPPPTVRPVAAPADDGTLGLREASMTRSVLIAHD
jgi:hypothetical protein